MTNLNVNMTILAGRLTETPELKTTPGGIAVTSFTLAVNRRRKKEEATQEADFIRCVAWRQTAEFLCRYFKKGSAVYAVGEIQTRSWVDQSGVKRYATEVMVNDVRFVDSKQESGAAGTETGMPAYVPDAYTGTGVAYTEIQTDEDLPF